MHVVTMFFVHAVIGCYLIFCCNVEIALAPLTIFPCVYISTPCTSIQSSVRSLSIFLGTRVQVLSSCFRYEFPAWSPPLLLPWRR